MNKNYTYINKFADYSLNPSKWNWVNDYVKPLWNRDQYANKLLQNNQFGNYVARYVSNGVANSYRQMSAGNRFIYLMQKFLQMFGINFGKDSLSYKFDEEMRKKYNPNYIKSQFGNMGTHLKLIAMRNKRQQLYKGKTPFNRDPYSQENITATFGGSHNTLDNNDFISNMAFNKIRPEIARQINTINLK